MLNPVKPPSEITSLKRPLPISDHVSNYQIFPSQITVVETSQKRPSLVSNLPSHKRPLDSHDLILSCHWVPTINPEQGDCVRLPRYLIIILALWLKRSHKWTPLISDHLGLAFCVVTYMMGSNCIKSSSPKGQKTRNAWLLMGLMCHCYTGLGSIQETYPF